MKLPNPLNLIPAPYRWIAVAVGVVLLLFVVIAVGDRIGSFIRDPLGWGRANQAQDRAGAVTGQHGKAASDAAAKAKADFDSRQQDRDELGKVNRDDIQGQKDAGADAGDTGRAFLRSLCRRQPDDPRCP
jgi:hypothetical protein